VLAGFGLGTAPGSAAEASTGSGSEKLTAVVDMASEAVVGTEAGAAAPAAGGGGTGLVFGLEGAGLVVAHPAG